MTDTSPEPTPEPTPQETRENQSLDLTRSDPTVIPSAWDTVQALGGPTAIVTSVGITAKYVKDIANGVVADVMVAKIEANAKIEVARIENGYRMEGGEHRADD